MHYIRNIRGRKIRGIFTGGPPLAHSTQPDRCAAGALTGPSRYATYCTNEVAPVRDAKVDAPANSRRSAERSWLIVAKFSDVSRVPLTKSAAGIPRRYVGALKNKRPRI